MGIPKEHKITAYLPTPYCLKVSLPTEHSEQKAFGRATDKASIRKLSFMNGFDHNGQNPSTISAQNICEHLIADDRGRLRGGFHNVHRFMKPFAARFSGIMDIVTAQFFRNALGAFADGRVRENAKLEAPGEETIEPIGDLRSHLFFAPQHNGIIQIQNDARDALFTQFVERDLCDRFDHTVRTQHTDTALAAAFQDRRRFVGFYEFGIIHRDVPLYAVVQRELVSWRLHAPRVCA